ncbi:MULTISPECIES: NAD+ synthase [unclassified Thermotoga]|uniref:NAD+ synthase n=1 Tax=unclassified Thermotoga TaxID=2631113 RepID=UPI000280E7FA|nr:MULTISPECIES: NAD+ synthase [unclassified Thermotoga]AIY87082.1 NAD synthetase [Thermotoga sp. 2812B]EJX25799.1 NAD synthetase [Thermotoga sp. EMP]
MKRLRVTLAQLNPTLGDFEGNLKKAVETLRVAEDRGSDLLIFPELFLPGYPPEDLMLRLSFLRENRKYLQKFAQHTKNLGVTVLMGFIDSDEDAYNAAAVVKDGEILGVYRKISLPNYGVFDERRYFKPGEELLVVKMDEIKVGITICEDIWNPVEPSASLSLGEGVHLIANLSASPYHVGKPALRKDYLSMKAYDYHVAVAYCNMVGGQDELVFDGGSMVVDASGEVINYGKLFEENIITVDLDLDENLRVSLVDPRRRYMKTHNYPVKTVEAGNLREKSGHFEPVVNPLPVREEEMFRALITGLRDYVKKNGFEKVVIGLSGGMDSSLVAVVATEALGKENVKGVLMPSMYTSKESIEDAQTLAKNLGIETFIIPITDVFHSYLEALKDVFAGREPDITEENLQARIRGNYLMALSNKFGWLVLTTGNKSEMATGYATLYGDMAGGFAVIKDVYKTDVYRIGRWYNSWRGKEIIPENIFVKPPTAELKPGQTDQEKLPPYEVLDEILRLYIEEGLDPEEIASKGFDRKTVLDVTEMVRKNEYKRKQAAIGVKISTRAFGKDWRMPITNRFKEPL